LDLVDNIKLLCSLGHGAMRSKLFFVLMAMGGLSWVGSVAAQAIAPAAVKANNCAACHQVDQKRVGPSFQQIANRFAGAPDAAAYLAAAIRTGSRGNWGAVPMPAQRQVSEDQAQAIAEWILTLAKDKAVHNKEGDTK
jgi:cytochrome c